MNRIFFLLSGVLGLLTLSCTSEMNTAEIVRMKVSYPASSKVHLDKSCHTVWNSGDLASVFYGGGTDNIRARYVGSDGASEGDIMFTHEGDIPFDDSYALVPYDAGASISGSVISTKVPVLQAYDEGSYAPGSAILAARTSSDSFEFRYAVSVIALEISSSGSSGIGIKSVVLHSSAGEPVAGDIDIDLSDKSSALVTQTGSSSDSVLMKAAGGGNICELSADSVKTLYFCVAPVTLSEGYYFDITLENDEHRTVRSTNAVSLTAGTLYRICAGVTVTKSIIIDFDELVWSPAFPAGSGRVTDSLGVQHSFTNPSDGLTYSIVAYSETGGYFKSGTFLRFNSPGNALKLPMIAGMRLVTFGAMVKQIAGKSFCVSSDRSLSGDIVSNTSYPSGQMIYSPVYGNFNESYIVFPANNTQLERIELYFE